MKKGLVILLLFYTALSFSQLTIKGKVHNNIHEPLEGASVYFNNTTVGTITNSKGEFELKIQEGNYNLIVSYIGYKTKKILINSENKHQKITIQLQEDTNVLNEVVIKDIVYDYKWKRDLFFFKRAFFGRSAASKKCKIVNEKDLYFSFDETTNIFHAYAKKSLIIKNKELGYLITYDLVDFVKQDDKIFFSGYVQFKDLRKNVSKKWRQNRLKAFNGSRMHFLRSLLQNKTEEEGFIIHRFSKIVNPERPSDEQIELARKTLKPIYAQVDFDKVIVQPKTKIDSALVTIRKFSLPKYLDYFTEKNISDKHILSYEENIPYLDFKGYLNVVYKYEPEEYNYIKLNIKAPEKAIGMQPTKIALIKGKTAINSHGIVAPKSMLTEGYWAFESIGAMLPLNYKPLKN